MMKKALQEWRSSGAIRRRVRRIKRRDSRCHRCGLLGFYRLPDQNDSTLEGLEELPVGQRETFEGTLRNARKAGRLRDSEYDPRIGQDLGVADWLYGGVKCGIGDRRGAFTTWTVPGPREDIRSFMGMGHKGALVRVPDPAAPGPFGTIRGVAQTFIWNVVRPHDCPYFIKHRPGMTPAEHIQMREDRRKRLNRSVRNWLLSIGGSVIGGLILWAVLGS